MSTIGEILQPAFESLLKEYDEYFTRAEAAQKIPLTYQKWLEADKPDQ